MFVVDGLTPCPAGWAVGWMTFPAVAASEVVADELRGFYFLSTKAVPQAESTLDVVFIGSVSV